ncbi:light harvesting protein [Emiliania huxleyi CCMP1516]|uniref:Light harvesting protein n=2 Tax=Emiliania huxleyi TaxID=2903 RepID=A0A0D3I556_EMIH1|nr:light harvesting protein [Emiliania huxleyi CCMP1516]EOD06391.1 light harvesting protein [Emiliania huxleyi CCMP1516]|eukprot:XP_005758820.1 light harvesting protein [Emiliania huxleyi CCMP1516]
MLSIAATSLPTFTAPLLPHATRVAAPVMKAEGEIGVTPPLGVWDPLGCLAEPVDYPRRDYRRYVELEIKHGRIAMLATVGVLTTEAGFRWPGYLSKSLDLKFADLPGGCFDSYNAVPALGWLQIVGFEPGDVGGISWVRYDDPETKKFKLNAERNNGRAAMMGITGMMIHNALGVDALFPIVQ